MRFLTAALACALAAPAAAQTLNPSFITSIGGATCGGGTAVQDLQLRMPSASNANRIDVFLLFDDTGSFADEVPTVVEIFRRVVALLQAEIPSADIAYGIGRFEDYGGPGRGYSNEDIQGRPFILNQAILSRSVVTFLPDLNGALANRGPGFGGDAQESSAGEALYQVATGAGFDGDGDGSLLGSGPAGALLTQLQPGNSGDVPPFSSYVGTTSGSEGGVGWRENSLRIVILATDIAPVAPFDPNSPIPLTIAGTGSTEPTTVFQGSSIAGNARFGFVGNSVSAGGNTVPNAVAPLGAATIPQAVGAANAAGIRVIGLAPGGAPTSATGPSNNPSVMLSALARLTGGVDSNGDPLLFDINGGLIPIALGIVDAVVEIASLDLDLQIRVAGAPAGLDVNITPTIFTGVGPGDTATFQVTFNGDPGFAGGSFALQYRDTTSGTILGRIPVTLECLNGCTTVDFETLAGVPLPHGADVRKDVFAGEVMLTGLSSTGQGPAIFDTDPMGPGALSSDPDLLVGTGNAVILQEGSAQSGGIYIDPDDDRFGGELLFDFIAPREVCAIDLIDFDLAESGESLFVLSDVNGLTRRITVPGGFTEDIAAMGGPGIRRLGLGTLATQQGLQSRTLAVEDKGFDETMVRTLRIDFAGSGAVDNLMFRGGPIIQPLALK